MTRSCETTDRCVDCGEDIEACACALVCASASVPAQDEDQRDEIPRVLHVTVAP